MADVFMMGYDYGVMYKYGIKIPLYASINSHLIMVGSSGSGKSTAILYLIYKSKKYGCKWYIIDFKASKEFVGITERYAEFEESINVIRAFYNEFLDTPEGGDGIVKVLLIDEIAGLLTHYCMTKDGKMIADEVRRMMSSILMLGRSKKCYLWLVMQRYTASIFPSASGAADNFHVYIGLGRLTPDSRKGLFAGEHFAEEEHLVYGQARGIVLIDGQPLRGLIIPKVSKQKLLALLQCRC